MSRLIVFAGLSGSGKSSIARGLAKEMGALWLRVDSIEQAIRESGIVPGSVDDAGYRAAYALAQDNLRLGHDVIGDSVNPKNRFRGRLTRESARELLSTCIQQNILIVQTDPTGAEDLRLNRMHPDVDEILKQLR